MKEMIEEINELDNYGILTESMPENVAVYDFKKIKEYCAKYGKTISEIPEKELEQFLST